MPRRPSPPDDPCQTLFVAVQDQQNGPRTIRALAKTGFDLNSCRDPHTQQHPIFLAIACHHMGIVQVLLESGVRFDHRDPRHHNASVIQRLRSLRSLFEETVASPQHKATRDIAKRRLAATVAAIAMYEGQLARGEVQVIPDVVEPTHDEVMQKLQERLQNLGIIVPPSGGSTGMGTA
jgi:hypothetical protein